MTRKYVLRCPECGSAFDDEFTNFCPHGCAALLKTEYSCRLTLRAGTGILRFGDWLPAENTSDIQLEGVPITYKSDGLAEELRLRNLYISFSGYFPERNAYVKTCTFKEFEALPTFLRVAERAPGRILVVSSVGNTARAFAQVSAETGMPVVLVVPKRNVDRVWTVGTRAENAFLVAVDGDYRDAITMGGEIAALDGFIAEGGARNVARRDGLGVVLLDAAFHMSSIPAHYFQAVGSGTGALGVWEAALRLNAFGIFKGVPKLHLSQNLPFAPMFRAWKAGRSELIDDDVRDGESIKKMHADVLSNRKPPYSVRGGVYDALTATGGEMYGVNNDKCIEAERIFESEEGIDLDPAAAVCVASLMQAVEAGVVDKGEKILLNVTGGGYKRLKKDLKVYEVRVRAETEGMFPELKCMLEEFRDAILPSRPSTSASSQQQRRSVARTPRQAFLPPPLS